jgi:hypothetical protein
VARRDADGCGGPCPAICGWPFGPASPGRPGGIDAICVRACWGNVPGDISVGAFAKPAAAGGTAVAASAVGASTKPEAAGGTLPASAAASTSSPPAIIVGRFARSGNRPDGGIPGGLGARTGAPAPAEAPAGFGGGNRDDTAPGGGGLATMRSSSLTRSSGLDSMRVRSAGISSSSSTREPPSRSLISIDSEPALAL